MNRNTFLTYEQKSELIKEIGDEKTAKKVFNEIERLERIIKRYEMRVEDIITCHQINCNIKPDK